MNSPAQAGVNLAIKVMTVYRAAGFRWLDRDSEQRQANISALKQTSKVEHAVQLRALIRYGSPRHIRSCTLPMLVIKYVSYHNTKGISLKSCLSF